MRLIGQGKLLLKLPCKWDSSLLAWMLAQDSSRFSTMDSGGDSFKAGDWFKKFEMLSTYFKPYSLMVYLVNQQ